MTSRFLVLPMAILQFLVGYLPNQMGWGTDIGTRVTRDGIPPELPPGPFFAIWGIIFTAYFAFGVYALRKENDLTAQLSTPLVLAGLFGTSWMVVAQFVESTPLETIILFPLIVFAWRAAWLFDLLREKTVGAMAWTTDLLTGLLSGWAIVALSISVPRLGRETFGQGPTDEVWYSLWAVIITAAIATWVFRNRISRSLWYYAALSWGILGILVNNWTRTGYGLLGWVALIFGLVVLYRRFRAGAYGAAGKNSL